MEATTKSPTTLLTFPAEIRNLIFHHALGHRTGRVSLELTERKPLRMKISEYDEQSDGKPMRTPLSLSLLQTYKQIYEERKDVLLMQNQIVIHTCPSLNSFKYDSPFNFIEVQDLNLHVDLTDFNEWWQGLGKYTRCCELKSFTLVCNNYLTPGFQMFFSIMYKEKELIDMITSTFRSVGGELKSRKIQKKLVLKPEAVEFLHLLLDQTHAYDNAMYDFHDAFGGELWVEDGLCWKEGKRVVELRE